MERSRVTELQYIAPLANIGQIVDLGILSHERAEDVDHESVALEEVQDIRHGKRVPNGRMLHEYANVYFDARNPMMYRRLNVKREIVVVRVNPDILDLPNVVITDGNAASGSTAFYPSPGGLVNLDEDRVYATYWTDNDPWAKYEKKRQRCAEVLIPDVIPSEYLHGCYVCHQDVVQQCLDLAPDFAVEVRARVFFG
jgi:hypothetical protein